MLRSGNAPPVRDARAKQQQQQQQQLSYAQLSQSASYHEPKQASLPPQQQPPIFYAIGQTPPYPGVYARPGMNMQSPALPGQYAAPQQAGAFVSQNWSQLAQGQQVSQMSQISEIPQVSYMPQNYGPAPVYFPSPLLSPMSPPSLSPSAPTSMTSPQSYDALRTPTSPTVLKPGNARAPPQFTFKVRTQNECSPRKGAEEFAQLLVEIFSTQPDEAAFPLVDAMITRELNAQRRQHEDSMDMAELERKDHNGYYVCRQCGQDPPRYMHLKSLVRHTSTHLITKPFSCLFCSDRFTRTDVARKHLLSCRVLRTCLMKFGAERTAYIQRVLSSSQRCLPGKAGQERRKELEHD